MTPYLGPLRFGDYSTILKYFAIRSAFADFGLYVIALRRLGELRDTQKAHDGETISDESKAEMKSYYGKFVMSRFTTITIVYAIALIIAYLIPAYTSNPYLVRGLPLGMLFSASFMISGILQLPLQLYRGMKHVSIGLTLARVAQIIALLVVVNVMRSPDFSLNN
jgi:O-antigen/teichoic acid export membrane protein